MENIIPFKNKHPNIDENVYINPYAMVMGEVTIHAGASLWPGVIVRGDEEYIEIGAKTALLDRCLVEAPREKPVVIGSNVLVSHNAKLHGCTIDDGVLIGINTNILAGAVIGSESVLAANTLVPPNTIFPPRSKVSGIPGEIRGHVTERDLIVIRQKHADIMKKAREYGEWFVAKSM